MIYRSDIDGLRAIAVTLVILVHAFPDWMQNGFVGVDIFFVISGYLITGILLNELSAGAFTLRGFYIRRANRIFPALILVLASCITFGWLSLYADEFKLLGRSVAFGAVFVANVGYFLEAGYWDVAAKLKPLLHLWSLGVEEQYYLLWPGLLWAAWTRRFNIAAVCVILIAASLGWNLWSTKAYHAASFYLPFGRLWELLAGGALAYANFAGPGGDAFRSSRLVSLRDAIQARVGAWPPQLVPNACSFVGLGFIIVALAEHYRVEEFPGKHTLWPALGAVLMIGAGPSAWINARILSQPAVVYVGLISFPLYLWHWPLVTFPRILNNGQLANKVAIAAIALTILLSIATYHLIERPIRTNHRGRGWIAIALSVLLAGCGLAGYAIYAADGVESRYQDPAAKVRVPLPVVSAGYKVALIGDSNAGVLAASLSEIYDNRLVTLVTAGWPNLPGLDFKPGHETNPRPTPEGTAAELARIASRPDIAVVVIMHQAIMYFEQENFRSTPVSPPDETSADAYEKALRRAAVMLTEAGKRVLYVRSIPPTAFGQLNQCMHAALPFPRRPGPVCTILVADIRKRQANYEGAFRRALDGLGKVSVFETMPFLCDSNACYADKDSVLMYRDGTHLSIAGNAIVGSAIAETIEALRKEDVENLVGGP